MKTSKVGKNLLLTWQLKRKHLFIKLKTVPRHSVLNGELQFPNLVDRCAVHNERFDVPQQSGNSPLPRNFQNDSEVLSKNNWYRMDFNNTKPINHRTAIGAARLKESFKLVRIHRLNDHRRLGLTLTVIPLLEKSAAQLIQLSRVDVKFKVGALNYLF